MSEHKIQNEGRNALAEPDIFNTRANVGKAWTGNEVIRIQRPGAVFLNPGDVVIRQARPFDSGLPVGFTDTFGVTSEIVTPQMVGEKVGIAHFIEYKAEDGRLSPRQKSFISAMLGLGARAGVARSAADAVAIARGIKT